MCSAVTVLWVGRVVGPEESRGCAERWRGSGEGREEATKTQDDRRVMPSQRWVVQRAQAGGGVMTTRRRTLAIGDRSGGAGGKARHSLCKSKCSLSLRGATGGTGSPVHPGCVCGARAAKRNKKGTKKKTARGRESEGRNKRVVGEGGTTSASETWGAARRAEGPPWWGRGHCQVGVA